MEIIESGRNVFIKNRDKMFSLTGNIIPVFSYNKDSRMVAKDKTKKSRRYKEDGDQG